MNLNNCCEIRNIFQTFEFCLLGEGIFRSSQSYESNVFSTMLRIVTFLRKGVFKTVCIDLFPLSKKPDGHESKGYAEDFADKKDYLAHVDYLCLDQSLKKYQTCLKNKKDRRKDSFCRKSMNLKFQAR